MHPLASWIILSYAAVLIAGGLFGWRLGGSRFSFTFRLASAALLTVAHRLSQIHPSGGYRMATGVSLALAVVFFLRFRKTGKFLPAGLLSPQQASHLFPPLLAHTLQLPRGDTM